MGARFAQAPLLLGKTNVKYTRLIIWHSFRHQVACNNHAGQHSHCCISCVCVCARVRELAICQHIIRNKKQNTDSRSGALKILYSQGMDSVGRIPKVVWIWCAWNCPLQPLPSSLSHLTWRMGSNLCIHFLSPTFPVACSSPRLLCCLCLPERMGDM
jgi:hypothetical protein